MKRVLIIATLTLMSSLMFGQTSFAQNPMREQRRENREVAEQQDEQQIMQLLKSKEFMFQANEIEQTMNPNLQNITLNSLWALWLTPNQVKVYLPIYGSSPVTGMPSLLRRMDFTAYSYDYNIQPGHSSGVNVTITANDIWSNTEYTFFIMATDNGQYSTMSVSSPYKAPVTFQGFISTTSISSDN